MSTAATETVKLWLSRYRQQSDYVERLAHELDTLEAKATSPGTALLDALPHAPGYAGDRMGGIVGRLDELRTELAEAQGEATAIRRELENAIKKIHGQHWPDRRAVLRFRYLLLLPWEDVNDALFGAKRDFLDREDSYMRRTYRLHGEALTDLLEFVPAETLQEIDTENGGQENEI